MSISMTFRNSSLTSSGTVTVTHLRLRRARRGSGERGPVRSPTSKVAPVAYTPIGIAFALSFAELPTSQQG